MKSAYYLLVLCLVSSVGFAVAQNGIDGNRDNTDKTANAIDDTVGNLTCFVNGTLTNMPRIMDNVTGMDNMTGAETYYINATSECTAMNNMTEGAQAGNVTKAKMCNVTGIMTLTPTDMTGMENMTGIRTYSITATVVCMPETTNNMTGGAQTGSMTEDMTGARISSINGTVTLIPADMTGSQGGNVNGMENMTEAHTYSISATVACMPEAMNNTTEKTTGETQTENMPSDQTGLNTTGSQEGSNMTDTGCNTGAKMCNITGIMTLTPTNMTGTQTGMTETQTEGVTGSQGGNVNGMENMIGARTYSITATVACMPEKMNNMVGRTQAENMTKSDIEYNSQTEVNTSGS
jgi:hypothetical protein